MSLTGILSCLPVGGWFLRGLDRRPGAFRGCGRRPIEFQNSLNAGQEQLQGLLGSSVLSAAGREDDEEESPGNPSNQDPLENNRLPLKQTPVLGRQVRGQVRQRFGFLEFRNARNVADQD